MALPLYQSHKKVRAAKIRAITLNHSDLTARLDLEGCGYEVVPMEWSQRHEPTIGGYYVVYEDGYTSFSPAAAFEGGYSRIEQ